MANETKQGLPTEKDVITECIGEFGRWQMLMNVLLPFVAIPCTFHLYLANFITDANATCAKPENSSLTQEQWIQLSALDDEQSMCTIRDLDYSLSYRELSQQLSNASIPCKRWNYDSVHFDNTLVSEWDLVCDRQYLLNVAEMMFLLGIALGGVVGGFISDRIGRRRTLMFCMVCEILVGVVIYWNPWFTLFLILRAILGFFCSSSLYTGLVLCLEVVGGKWFIICGISYMLTVPLSYIIISGIAYLTRNWRTLQLALSLSAVLLLPLYWIVPESPRWLLSSCQKERVKETLQKAADFNGKPLPDNLDELIEQGMNKTEKEPPKVRLMDLFRTSYLRKITLVLYVVWFFQCLLYYGLVLNLSKLGGDIYINSIISGLVELPSIALSIILLLKLGRRWPLAFAMAGAGAACIFSTLFNKDGLIHLVLIMIGRFLISSPNVTILIYTAELYPTIMRNFGMGSANIAAGISLVLIPYIWFMAGLNEIIPILIIGLGGILGGLATFLLPETAGLSDHMQKS